MNQTMQGPLTTGEKLRERLSRKEDWMPAIFAHGALWVIRCTDPNNSPVSKPWYILMVHDQFARICYGVYCFDRSQFREKFNYIIKKYYPEMRKIVKYTQYYKEPDRRRHDYEYF